MVAPLTDYFQRVQGATDDAAPSLAPKRNPFSKMYARPKDTVGKRMITNDDVSGANRPSTKLAPKRALKRFSAGTKTLK